MTSEATSDTRTAVCANGDGFAHTVVDCDALRSTTFARAVDNAS